MAGYSAGGDFRPVQPQVECRGIAGVVQRVHVLRLELQGLLVTLQRLLNFTAVGKQNTEVRQRIGVLRTELQGSHIARLGFVPPSQRSQRESEVVVKDGLGKGPG